METCYGCGRDVSTAKEKKQRRLLGSCTAQILNTLVYFFQLQGLGVDSGTLRRGYICRPCLRLVEKYQLLHEEVASNVRKVLPFLSMAAGGAAVHDVDVSCPASGSSSFLSMPQYSASAVLPSSTSSAAVFMSQSASVPQNFSFAPMSSTPSRFSLVSHAFPLPLSSVLSTSISAPLTSCHSALSPRPPYPYALHPRPPCL